ncbi:hypothetical protein BH11ARM2_BH11ARM2_17940 [soil metagenome]
MRKAFSLVETLVVLAIIILIAGIAFPVISQARDAAQQPTCMSNMRQIYIAASLYREDNGEWPGLEPQAPALAPYTKGAVFRCKDAEALFEGQPVRIDYLITGSPASVSPEMRSSFLECREQRGSSFPVVVDQNHSGRKRKVERGASFWLVGRADGSIHRVDDAEDIAYGLGQRKSPCDRLLTLVNL